MKIRDMYKKLSRDEEIIFQVKTKKAFNKIIKKMRRILDEWDFVFGDDYLDYKNTYFIIGMWRHGMFEIRGSREWDHERNIQVLADYKEMPCDEVMHLRQIDFLIDIMDEHRTDFVKKRLYMDEHFNLVK